MQDGGKEPERGEMVVEACPLSPTEVREVSLNEDARLGEDESRQRESSDDFHKN